MRMLVGLMVVGMGLTLATGASDADCASPSQAPELLSAGVPVQSGGGVVVGTVSSSSTLNAGAILRDAAHSGWKIAGADPIVAEVAPGLALLKFPKGITSGDLTDGSTVLATLTTATTRPTVIAAPIATGGTHADKGVGHGAATEVHVTTGTAAPAAALALVVYDVKTRKALSYGRVVAGATDQIVYRQASCDALPNGTVEPRAGQRVYVRWLDRNGLLSRSSKAITIR